MKISYRPLWVTLASRNMQKKDLKELAQLTTNITANMGKGKHVTLGIIIRICEALNCDLTDVIELVNDDS